MIDWLNNHPTLELALIVGIVFAFFGVIAYLGWPSKCDLDTEDEHARNPFRW